MRLDVSYRNRDAESSVFDTENTSFFISLDWEVVKKHIVYAAYKIEAGDTFSSATPPVGLPILEASNFNVVADDVFIGKNTYRLDATTQLITLG